VNGGCHFERQETKKYILLVKKKKSIRGPKQRASRCLGLLCGRSLEVLLVVGALSRGRKGSGVVGDSWSWELFRKVV
jgi:hypothetical protein